MCADPGWSQHAQRPNNNARLYPIFESGAGWGRLRKSGLGGTRVGTQGFLRQQEGGSGFEPEAIHRS